MGIVNRRNAFLGWGVWKVAKRFGKQKAKAADLGLSEDEVGWKGARQQITSIEAAPERQAGEKIEDEGDAHERIVAFLEQLKVI